MQNAFISPFDFPFTVSLINEQESRINSSINNLKINDVKDQTAFDRTTKLIKDKILVELVTFDEPKFVDHEYEERDISFQQQMSGHSRESYIHQVSVKFTGSNVLFSYRPDSLSFSNLDRGIIQPYSNEILVYVDLNELNPLKAVEEAKKLLGMTYRLIDGNNNLLKQWIPAITVKLEKQLNQKREQLISIFGS